MERLKSTLMRLCPRSWPLQIALLAGLALALTFSVNTAYTIAEQIKHQQNGMELKLAAIANGLAISANHAILVRDYIKLENLLLQSAEYPGIHSIEIRNPSNKLISQVAKESGQLPQVTFKPGKEDIPLSPKITFYWQHGDKLRGSPLMLGLDATQLVIWQPINDGASGWIKIEYDTQELKFYAHSITLSNLYVALGSIVVCMMLFSWFMRSGVRALYEATSFAQRLNLERGSQIQVYRGSREMQALGEALNMASQRLHNQEIDRIKAEAAIASSKAKSEFIANMSHEIRTPLTAIIGFSGILQDTNTTSTERIDSINAIIRNSTHLQQLVNDILDMSKIEANKLNVERIDTNILDLLDEIESLVGMQARNKGLVFKIEHRFPLPANIVTDPLRLKQILINLCNNAVKFTERGDVRIVVGYRQVAQEIYFEVIDSGIGLSEEQRQRLFQAFEQADTSTTRRFGGTGLGLAISKRLAELLGGTVSVTSTENQGSCFTVSVNSGSVHPQQLLQRLPIVSNSPITPSSSVLFKGHVLVAEDTIDNQMLFTLYIQKAGLNVTVVGNGHLAVDAALRNNFDLILMDMQMPVMDGLEAVQSLRRAGYTKPIVALTANTMKEDQDRCFLAGCNAFLAKPLRKEELVKIFARYLQTQPPIEINSQSIISKLIYDEPDLMDLVKTYIQRLPEMVRRVNDLHAQKNWVELSKVIHDIKGSGEGFGFPMLSVLAANIEFKIHKNDVADIKVLIGDFNTMCQKIRDGMHGSGTRSERTSEKTVADIV